MDSNLKSIIIVMVIAIISFFVSSQFNSALLFSPYIIEGDMVYVNDSNIYLSATPHTTSGGSVYLELISKVYSGNINLAFGFDSDNFKPRGLSLYNPINITTEHSFTCPTNENITWGYTVSPKWAWCYYNNVNGSNTTSVLFNNSFLWGDTRETQKSLYTTKNPINVSVELNLTAKTVYWNTSSIVDYPNKLTVDPVYVNYTLEDVDRWAIVTGLNVNEDQYYKAKIDLSLYNQDSGKYWVCTYPTSYGKNVQTAYTNGHLYCLDPWWEDASNYIAYSNFEEGSGSIALDLWNGNNGTIGSGCTYSTNVPTFNTSGSGGSYSMLCDGSVNTYVNYGDVAAFEFTTTDSFSVNMWIYNNGTIIGHPYGMGLFGKGHYTTKSRPVYYLKINAYNFTNYEGNLSIFFEAIDATQYDKSRGGNFLQAWNMVTMVYDASTFNVTVYQNSVNIGRLTAKSDNWGTNTQPFVLFNHINFDGNKRWFEGLADEFSMYKVKLNESNIINLYLFIWISNNI